MFRYASVEDRIEIDRGSMYRIFSMTKMVTSVAALTLCEDAQLDLFDLVSKYIPAFANLKVLTKDGAQVPCKTDMTIQHLLTHTSGLTYHFTENPVADMYKKHGINFNPELDMVEFKDIPLDVIVDKLAKLPLLAEPGTQWNYSIGIDVMGYIIEKITGKPLRKYMQEAIFTPLGMVDTDFWVPEGKVDRLTSLYSIKTDVPEGKLQFELGEDADHSSFTEPHNKLNSGGGGLISTTGDVSKFMLANMDFNSVTIIFI